MTGSCKYQMINQNKTKDMAECSSVSSVSVPEKTAKNHKSETCYDQEKNKKMLNKFKKKI